MLLLRHCQLSSQDLITCERALLRFISGRSKPVNLDFNVWDYTVPEIYGYILGMFVKLELVDCLGITQDELLDFIIDVDRGYLATFYHSFYHAADVTSVLYHMLQDMQASQYLSKPDMAALLLAGLCHDIGHPGLNNLFQVNAKTDLYKKYGEESVLEKYSCSLAMDLVTKHAIFRNISRSPTAILPEGNHTTECGMREAMVKAILATDMSFHYDMLNNLNNLIEATSTPMSSSGSEADSESDSEFEDEVEPKEPASVLTATRFTLQFTGADEKTRQFKTKTVSMASPLSTSTGPFLASPTEEQQDGTEQRQRSSSCGSSSSSGSSSSGSSSSPRSLDGYTAHDLTAEQRQSLCNCLLHAADVSNAVKPWTICKRWSDLVVQEFFRQGDIEKAQHLPVSPNMDRNQHNQPQISLGFSDFVVQPYFEAFVELLPDASPLLTTLADNHVHWVELQKSNQQFGYDPYLAVDPLEEPSLIRRPSSPLLASLNEKDTVPTFSVSSHSESIASPLLPISPPSMTPTATSRPELTRDRSVSDLKQRAPKNKGDAGVTRGGTFRQKRLASLQVGGQVMNTQQVYGDGYSVPHDQASIGAGHISASGMSEPSSGYASSKGTHPLSSSPAPPSLPQAGNRSSTPAVMMNKIKYDWALSPTLPEIPHSSRFGCGPLDGVDETMATQVTGGDTEPAPPPLDTSLSDPTASSSTPTISTSTVSPVTRKSVEFALEPSSTASSPAAMEPSVLLADGLSAGETPLGLVVSSSTVTPPASLPARRHRDVEGTVSISTASSPTSN
ncbi:hypothetical protein BGZ47_000519 [Haplosporangium gracile]|nr:hypothetical protein BGZ47_000519 [Haplosporangium gracile]